MNHARENHACVPDLFVIGNRNFNYVIFLLGLFVLNEYILFI